MFRPTRPGITVEAPLPQAVSDYGHLILSRPFLFGQERSSQERSDSEERKKVVRHLQPLDPHWLRAAGKDEVVSCVSSNLFEGVILLLKVVKVGGRNTDASTPAGLVDADDAIRVLVRERTEQHGMQNTKD